MWKHQLRKYNIQQIIYNATVKFITHGTYNIHSDKNANYKKRNEIINMPHQIIIESGVSWGATSKTFLTIALCLPLLLEIRSSAQRLFIVKYCLNHMRIMTRNHGWVRYGQVPRWQNLTLPHPWAPLAPSNRATASAGWLPHTPTSIPPGQ